MDINRSKVFTDDGVNGVLEDRGVDEDTAYLHVSAAVEIVRPFQSQVQVLSRNFQLKI